MKHAPNWNGDDRTLCGIALDARESGDVDEPVAIASKNETIDCPDCCACIKHCQEEFRSMRIAGLFRTKR